MFYNKMYIYLNLMSYIEFYFSTTYKKYSFKVNLLLKVKHQLQLGISLT